MIFKYDPLIIYNATYERPISIRGIMQDSV